MAAQSLGSVKVLVQPLKLSLDAIATELVSSRSVRTWNSRAAGAPDSLVHAPAGTETESAPL